MSNQRASYRNLRVGSRQIPDITKSIVCEIQRAISIHKFILEGLGDEVEWCGSVYTREGGINAMAFAMEGLRPGSSRYEQLKEDIYYWRANYNTIRKFVFNGEGLPFRMQR